MQKGAIPQLRCAEPRRSPDAKPLQGKWLTRGTGVALSRPALEAHMIVRNRSAFTLIELLIVVVIVGIVALVTVPRGHDMLVRNSVRSAKQEVAATLAVAKNSAIHNGRIARFVRNGNVVHARLEIGTQWDTLGAPNNMMSSHRVHVESNPDTIRFDPRGFALGINGAYQTVRVSRGTVRDSVCVTRFGRIITEGRCL
jgi:prepilin-type N-terminal cleavage/methylation domain-containing protein